MPNPVAIALLCLIVLLIMWLLREHGKQQLATPRSTKRPQSALHKRALESARDERKEYLVRLLYGDRVAAQRLIQGCRKRNPRMAEDWAVEVVIQQLLKDRSNY